ncbi:LysR family transcriptional regulator [Metaclostridioides mangenotii]|uniref:LysR family transcriptional regulator n=1 Tax=Metaclostridioides mangenotii TaxID=1540 RepID=UPI00048008FD|nr:LysR family transcriptional regulator [Clostridioides mangenotii]
MDINYLKSLYVTAQCNSISVAAKKLHLSQPGLSFQLQSLESSVGKTLLKRSNKGVALTPEGEIVYNYAKSFITIENNMQKELKEFGRSKRELTIGACSSLADYALPCSAYTFKQIHDDIDINILSMTSCEVLKKLRDRELNIGIIQSLNSNSDINEIPLIKSDIVLVCDYNVPTTSITINELMNLPLITREHGSIINESIAHNLKKQSLDFNNLNILFSLNSDEAIKRTLMHNESYAFLPELVIKHELHDKYLKKVFIKDLSLQCSYSLVYRNDYSLKNFEKLFKVFITSGHRCFCY